MSMSPPKWFLHHKVESSIQKYLQEIFLQENSYSVLYLEFTVHQ